MGVTVVYLLCKELKLIPRSPTQPTLLSILSEDKTGDEDEGQQEREDEADDEEDVVMAGMEEEVTECGHVTITEGGGYLRYGNRR